MADSRFPTAPEFQRPLNSHRRSHDITRVIDHIRARKIGWVIVRQSDFVTSRQLVGHHSATALRGKSVTFNLSGIFPLDSAAIVEAVVAVVVAIKVIAVLVIITVLAVLVGATIAAVVAVVTEVAVTADITVVGALIFAAVAQSCHCRCLL